MKTPINKKAESSILSLVFAICTVALGLLILALKEAYK